MQKHTTVPIHDAGEFLNWWFKTNRLDGKALQVFNQYYSNYCNNFSRYLQTSWSNRHLELDKFIDSIKERSNCKLLDLGCGTGSVALYMACKLGKRGEVLGVDIKKERLMCAIERKKILENEIGQKINCEFVESNVISFPSNPKFDLIYLEETLHHLEPRVKIIDKISRLLADNGILIISETNAYNPLLQFHLFRKRGFRTIKKMVGDDGKEYFYGVERILTAKVVAKHFKKCGLKMKSHRCFRLFSSNFAQWMEKKGIDLLSAEKRLLNIFFLKQFFSVHYNIVFEKVVQNPLL